MGNREPQRDFDPRSDMNVVLKNDWHADKLEDTG